MNHPIETQKGVLFSQLFHADETEYGRKYGFKDISSYRDFQQQVPIVNYEDFEPYIEKARQGQKDIIWPGYIRQFAKSSGTTNAKSKYIPISDESLEDCHYKAGKDLISIYANNHPENQLFLNKNLRLGGSAELYETFQYKIWRFVCNFNRKFTFLDRNPLYQAKKPLSYRMGNQTESHRF
jgi:hypothetical protein